MWESRVPDPSGWEEMSVDPDEYEAGTSAGAGLSELSGEEIVADIRRNISCIAFCHARVIALIDEVERRGLWAQWVGVTTLSQWVMHIAAVSAHTAREYVRVMMALREMPLVKENLESGDVSFSKVREVTRLVGRIPDEDAARLADVSTGSQIGVIARNYLQLSATDESAEIPRFLPGDSMSMRTTQPGRTRITIDLDEDEAAEIFSMLDTARLGIERSTNADADADADDSNERVDDSNAPCLGLAADLGGVSVGGGEGASGEGSTEDEKEPYEPISQVMCLMEIIHAFPQAGSAGTAAPDRARMLVHASAEVVTRSLGRTETSAAESMVGTTDENGDGESVDVPLASVPAGTSGGEMAGVPAGTLGDDDAVVPVGEDLTCRIDGYGGITSATAERLTCEALITGAVKDADGDVLMLGRSKRLVSRRQRLALSARDIGCQFPGCRARRRCDAHHIRPWSQGGATDMDNLILLCRTHHTAVHAYEMTISRTGAPFAGALNGPAAFAFFLPDGSQLLPLESGRHGRLVFDTALLVQTVEEAVVDADPSTLGGGYGFNLDLCIAWMFEAEIRHARADNEAA